MQRKVRVGVIGCGMVFAADHLPAFLQLHDVQLVSFYDIVPERAELVKNMFAEMLQEQIARLEAGERPNQTDSWYWSGDNTPQKMIAQHQETLQMLTVHNTAEELLDNVDVVTVCTPVRFHTHYSVMALKRGVHVMCEKAMARNWYEAQQIVKAAQDSSALYQLNDDNVFLPRYDTLKNIIESGHIGELQSMWIARGIHGPERRAWFWNPEWSGGGSLMDYGTHAVTSLWYLVGFDAVPRQVKSLRIESRMKTRPLEGRIQKVKVEDDAHIRVLFEQPNGNWCDAVIEATWSYPEFGEKSGAVNSFIRIQGSDGEATGYTDEEGKDYIRVEKYGYGAKLFPVVGNDDQIGCTREIENFIQCVRQGRESILNERVAIGTMEVMGAAYLSELRGRKPVTPEEYREFCQSFVQNGKSDEEIILSIIHELMRPYSEE